MAKRLTDDNVKGQQIPSDDNLPANDSVPEDELAADGLPLVFCDVDMDLKKSPHMFDGFEDLKPQTDDTISKSEVDRVWQYNRWKTWKYLKSQKTRTIIIDREENEDDKARGTASINGVTYYIIKGTYVDVPMDIGKLIETSQGATAAAGQDELVSNISRKIDPVTGAPKDPTRLE